MTAPLRNTAALSQADVTELTQWRRAIHQLPDLSGQEARTAATVVQMLDTTTPDRIVSGLGGHGVAALYDSGVAGPRVLLRCELDGLPIHDLGAVPHRSQIDGKGHQCGHDGHMAIMAAMARLLGRQRPQRGSVVLMFQPAEEDGSGANLVVSDPAFADLVPDYAFAIHNLPGQPLGHVAVIDGPTSCASRGMKLTLTGKTAHASEPATGVSPMQAVAQLMPALTALAPNSLETADPEFSLVTVTHAAMGAPSFGVAPGEAHIYATLRTLTDEKMAGLVDRAEALARSVAAEQGLGLDISYEDVFVTSNNNPEATDIVRTALDHLAISHGRGPLPFRASEDFGHFGRVSKMCLFMLGAGEQQPALHNPDYDFPDDLIAKGAEIFSGILDQVLGQD